MERRGEGTEAGAEEGVDGKRGRRVNTHSH